MAKVEGYSCDVCSKYAEGRKTSTGVEKPEGWFVLHLPKTEHDNTAADRAKDICSAKCLITFGRERHAIDNPKGPKKTKAEENRSSAEVIAAYDAAGFTNGQRISMSRTHNAQHSDDDPVEGCIPCEVAATS
jgi:hypothetical protein